MLVASRLQVEVCDLEVYLGREDWWHRLWPDQERDFQKALSSRLLSASRPYTASAQSVSFKLDSSLPSSGG
jgi:hypothetical protein